MALSFRVTGRWVGLVAIIATGALYGCATPPSDPAERAAFVQNNDPLEPLNRKTLAFNQFLDKIIFRPAAKTYVAVIPGDARAAIHHVLDNMKEPTLFFNNLLQGEFKRAEISAGRFVVNSTVGFAGMVDVMTLSGFERQPADFGQTLYVWGVSSGPYLMLPVVGPSNPRDAFGAAVDSYDDPFTIIANAHGVTELTTGRLIVGGIDERAGVLDELDDLEKNSIDFYAQLRSLSQQHRNAELHHGAAPKADPGLYNDPGQKQPSQSAPAPKPQARATPITQIAAAPPGQTVIALPELTVTAPAPRPMTPAPREVDPDEGALR